MVAAALLWLLARWLRRLVAAALVRRRMRAEVVHVVARSVFVAAIVLGIIVLAGAATGNSGFATSGVLAATLLAGLGVQDILRNYVSGVYLLAEARFKPGDLVEFGAGKVGRIVDIRFRVTYVRADDGSLIVVPNTELFNQVVTIHASPQPEHPDADPQPASAATAPTLPLGTRPMPGRRRAEPEP